MFSFVRSAAAALIFAILATGCVSMPEQQAFNREAHANVKTVAVLETWPTRTSVFMLHHPGASFGLNRRGGRRNRQAALRAAPCAMPAMPPRRSPRQC
jgi:hypothetical protein